MFKHFAQFSTSPEPWVTRATWVTETTKPRKPAASEPDCRVAQNENARATEGNQQQTVAQVAQRQEDWATKDGSQGMAENCRFLESVAQVAQVAQENDTAGTEAWDAEDWRVCFEERAAIAEHDGELSRAEAESLAFECCVVAWLNCHPPIHDDPHQCVHCGELMAETEALPFLTGDGGHVWMHSGCHEAWMVRRRAAATAGLVIMGIRQGSGD